MEVSIMSARNDTTVNLSFGPEIAIGPDRTMV